VPGAEDPARGVAVVLRRGPAPPVVVSRRAPGKSLHRAAVEAVVDAVTAAGPGETVPPDVWAVDLSVPWAVLATDLPDPHARLPLEPATTDGAPLTTDQVRRATSVPPVRLGFRPLSRADLPDVVTWQRRPHVERWWHGEAADLAGAEAHYGPAIDGDDPTRMWVLEVNGRSVGLLQDYLVGDHPDWALLTARPEAVGFDYLVGDPSWVGRGVGTRALWTYLRDVVRPHYPGVRELFAAPDHRNAVSLRVLDKLGFRRGLWFDEPQPGGGVDTVVGCSLDVATVLA
jgi:aminoglycoside 6'-N-acetyltransferase